MNRPATTRSRATLVRMVMPGHVCPFGLKALHLLKSRGYEVEDRHLTTRAEVDAYKAEVGVKTTPQVFINGERIGGHVYGCDVCQDVCPWNVRFAKPLPEGSPYAAREALNAKDTRSLARDLLGMSQPEFSAAFKGSPMKRAKRRGLARNAAVALGNVGTAEDIPVLEGALTHDEPLVREHAAWAIAQVRARRQAK